MWTESVEHRQKYVAIAGLIPAGRFHKLAESKKTSVANAVVWRAPQHGAHQPAYF